ncbi:MAG: arsenate reductase ArsC [Candidatus Omnitrophota bacterium]
MLKKILFVCVENSCRSQMAEGIAKHLGKGILEVYSSGSKPKGGVDPSAVKVMQEIGIDISSYKPKGFNEIPIRDFDYVITLGCKDICPFFPAEKHIEWHIDDPKGKDIDSFRKARDTLKYRIEQLIKDTYSENKGA